MISKSDTKSYEWYDLVKCRLFQPTYNAIVLRKIQREQHPIATDNFNLLPIFPSCFHQPMSRHDKHCTMLMHSPG
jgi:hypothetical protein